jgi:hypothetical protein
MKEMDNTVKTDIIKEKEINYTEYQFFNQLVHTRFIIKLIFLFLILSLALQIYIYLLLKNNFMLKDREFHISEFAINSSPMLGLLGTFFSISLLLGQDSNNISGVLIDGFFDAVMTTILGISFYLISFYLKIFIYPKIEFNE